MNESNHEKGEALLDRGRYYGTATSHRATRSVTLAEGRYAADARIPSHAHRAPYFCLVLEGSFEETWGSSREVCGPGTLVFHHAHEVHADRFGPDGARCFNLELSAGLAERLADEGALPPARLTLGPGRVGTMAAELRAAPRRTPLEIAEAVLAVIAHLTESKGGRRSGFGKPAWLGRSVERLWGPAPMSIAALADEAGVHPVYFTRAFRAALGTTPSEVARRAKLERAAAELLRSEASVTSVAHAAGYADHSHFCRHFRREFGVTPSRYRVLFA